MGAISRNDVLHVARLAALEVPEADLPQLVDQLQRIVAMVGQLAEIPAAETAPDFHAGPASVALRADTMAPEPLAHPLAMMAPGFAGSFFAVPRHTAMEGE